MTARAFLDLQIAEGLETKSELPGGPSFIWSKPVGRQWASAGRPLAVHYGNFQRSTSHCNLGRSYFGLKSIKHTVR